MFLFSCLKIKFQKFRKCFNYSTIISILLEGAVGWVYWGIKKMGGTGFR